MQSKKIFKKEGVNPILAPPEHKHLSSKRIFNDKKSTTIQDIYLNNNNNNSLDKINKSS